MEFRGVLVLAGLARVPAGLLALAGLLAPALALARRGGGRGALRPTARS